jgi:ElaB/YqjD/DUF883 family membrane-anchored ribosome-binding protein
MADRAGEWRPAAARTSDEHTPEPAAIRAGIRETRERLGDTLEALGERLNPHHITDRIKHDIRDATIGRVEHMARHAADRVHETRSSMMDTIRENPIPAAMVGIGLGWLFMNRRRTDGHASSGRDLYAAHRQPRVDAYDTGAYGAAGTYDSRYYAGGAAYAGGPAYPARDHDADAPGAVDRARERAQETAHAVADRTQQAAHTVAQQTRTQVRRVEDRFEEQPLVVGAATLALGLAAGLALPVSDREVQLMGDARDRLVDRVRDVAEETAGKVQHVASRVMDEAQTTARDASRDEGLGGPRASQL